MKDEAYGVDTLFAQITHAAPSASRKEPPLFKGHPGTRTGGSVEKASAVFRNDEF